MESEHNPQQVEELKVFKKSNFPIILNSLLMCLTRGSGSSIWSGTLQEGGILMSEWTLWIKKNQWWHERIAQPYPNWTR